MPTRLLLTAPLLLAASLTDARADEFITCESRDNRYQSCALPWAGYVSLDRKLSGADCRQGRSWDYDRREVWVDDGCRASFRVHDGGGRDGDDRHDGNHDAKVAAGVLIGAAILGALVHNANKQDDRYDDDTYQGARHNSYVPGWMVGEFEGFNPIYNADIRMTIDSNGRMSARARGQNLSGWVNGGQLNVGNSVFDISQSRDGFVTTEVGDRQNEVRYRRVR
ncbi:DUF3011 domain-containing protein [Stenotrophomonas rhizophila]|uniref:DUF3011 domain-containing protein n=1 Tax=Stenotrophomonas rhizophila TaxID=216778 RepID=UPI001E5BEAB5|nr:DUF3011 domain-containing protein [Stenotrophomonas rhizophila]MCC7632601.1 DUF3011 domain-containing protein [Stenotrophomonas rhizophila]MCC7663453.1 DUF3011 domain-containing protein [Stenotrophomonas rhizophila]